jgi:hypothetical protein
LKEKLLHPKFHIVRFFLDRILCQQIDLHSAGLKQDKTLVERLVPHDTNKRDEGGRTALFWAVLSYIHASKTYDEHSEARCQILNILLQNGADSSIPDKVFCWRPFHVAVKTEAWYAAGLLLQKYPAHRNHSLVRKNIYNKPC